MPKQRAELQLVIKVRKWLDWFGLVWFSSSSPLIHMGPPSPDSFGLLLYILPPPPLLCIKESMCETNIHLSICVPSLFRWDLQVNQKWNVVLHILLNICERLSLAPPSPYSSANLRNDVESLTCIWCTPQFVFQ